MIGSNGATVIGLEKVTQPNPTQPSPAERIKALAQGVQMRAMQQPALSPILAELVGMLTYSVSELNQLRQEVLMLAASLDAPSPETAHSAAEGVAESPAPKSGDDGAPESGSSATIDKAPREAVAAE